MSNLTSASNEASLSSSSNKNEVGTMYPPPQQMQQSFASVPINSNNQTQTNKKKRNLPGNPDPEAEVVAMSPKSLMATNRFLCEICNKGFQRDQNLQLHRRGHNLPWKLKQRSKQEVVRKKVYVCPEPSCVHHEPSRALGDLTGIKKHFSRKHGEKKWKCEKCSKRYAVQSDWKAHSKICGTREHRCDCGTLFSRRDSFITHRAFCGALAGENARSSSSSLLSPNHLPLHLPINYPLKSEPHLFQRPQVLNSNIITNTLQNHQLPSWFVHHHQENPSPNNNNNNNNLHLPSPSSPPHMSATALLQKAAQMGVTMSKPAASTNTAIVMSQQQQQQHQSIPNGPHQNDHMCASTLLTAHHHDSGLENLSCSDDDHHAMLGLKGGFANVSMAGCLDQIGATTMHAHSQMLHTNSLACTSVGSTALQEAFNGMLNSTKGIHNTGFQEAFFRQASEASLNPTKGGGGGGRGGGGGGNDELTRDFLGLTGFPPPTADHHHHLLNMAGLDPLNTSPYHHHQQQQQQQQQQHNLNQNQNQLPWNG
ncbi:protein indeterminate-domain 7-like isoform X2 [Cynara cardunculus var. scolymus]|nr:protein indeterminate-domain 7-like isoform X2 [Cynara cardunculus var. scolymus]